MGETTTVTTTPPESKSLRKINYLSQWDKAKIEKEPIAIVYKFYYDYLAPFIVSLAVSVLDKLKSDPAAIAVVFRRDGIQIDVALEMLRSLSEYSDITAEQIQKMDITKSVVHAALENPQQNQLLREHVAQAGLNKAHQLFFVDTGFNNTIPRRLREEFLPAGLPVQSMFLVSMNDQAIGLIYDKNNVFAFPGDQAMKPEAGTIVEILESLGKGIRQKITHLVKKSDGSIHGSFSLESDQSTRKANLSALRAIVDYINGQSPESITNQHRNPSFLYTKKRQLEEKLVSLNPDEKKALLNF